MSKEDYKYNLISLDYHNIKQELIDDEQHGALEKLHEMSSEDLNNIILKADNKVNQPRADLHCDFLYEVVNILKGGSNEC